MGVVRNCPKCGAAIQPTDLVCMECGADIVAERKRIQEEAKKAKPATFGRQKGATMERLAARGVVVAGETSEATRMRGFDRQEADRLKKEQPTAYATAAIALCVGLGFAVMAVSGLKTAGMERLKELSPASVRSLGWGVATDPAVSGVWFLGMTISMGLCFAGQLVRGLRIGHSVALVAAGQKPEIVGISAATKFGVLLFGIFCPPLGIIFGIGLMIGGDPESKALGSMTLWISIVALVVMAANMLWGLAATKLKPAPKPSGGTVPEEEARALWYAVVGLVGWRRLILSGK